MKRILGLTFSALLGFGLGWWVGRPSVDETIAQGAVLPTSMVGKTSSPISGVSAMEVEAETATEPVRLSANQLWSRISALRGLEALRLATTIQYDERRGEQKTRIPPMVHHSDNAQLTDEFCAAMELPPR